MQSRPITWIDAEVSGGNGVQVLMEIMNPNSLRGNNCVTQSRLEVREDRIKSFGTWLFSRVWLWERFRASSKVKRPTDPINLSPEFGFFL